MTNTLSFVYFPAALALGALHALEPGHAKALTAAYLIGIRGTKRDSVVLGLSVAVTHSIVVILIAGTGLWLGNEAFTGDAVKWLERASGLIAIAIGSWMLYRRLFIKRRRAAPLTQSISVAPMQAQAVANILAAVDGKPVMFEKIEEKRGHPHGYSHAHGRHHHHDDHDHDHLDDEAHARAHAETLPEYVKSGEKPSLLQIAGFGAAGGMIPCPASITVMLLALSTGRAAMGFVTVLAFSLGLALALVGVGLAIVSGLSKLSSKGRLSWVTRQAPVVSAALVIASGCFALFIAH
jgi:nickel/cobalt exporter